MSLTMIALGGILLGFLCVLLGFFMESEKKAPRVRKLKTRN